MFPLKINIREKKFLYIKWDDDSENNIKLANLRANCPCAVCSSERDENGPKYIPLYSDEQLAVLDVNLVGNYAIGIAWKDGHNTGIFEFGHLKELAEAEQSK